MAVIDLREDPRVQMQLYGNIGQGIGQSVQMIRRTRLQQGIVSTLQNGIANGLTPVQMRSELLKLPGIVNTQIGQELMEAQTGTGRYYQHPLTLEYLQSRIDATKALTQQRETGGNNLIELKRLQDMYQNIYDNAETEEEAEQAAEALRQLNKHILSQTSGNQPSQALLNIAEQWLTPSKEQANIPSQVKVPEVTAGKTAVMKKGKGIAQRTKQWLKENQMPTGPVGTFAQGIYSAKGIMQNPADKAIKKEIGEVDAVAGGMAPMGLQEIWNEITDEEKQTVLYLINEKGYTPQQLVSYFKSLGK